MTSAVVRGSKRARSGEEVIVGLAFTPPYDWAAMLDFFRSHCIPRIERVTEDAFARVFRLGDVVGFFQVSRFAGESKLTLSIVPGEPAIIAEVIRRVRRMFDLDCDPAALRKHFRATPLCAALNRRFRGLRTPCGWDAFETSVCAILGQVVSARQRAQLIGQLVECHGQKIPDAIAPDMSFLFPKPQELTKAKLNAVRTTNARREAIRDFSRRVSSGAVSLSYGQDLAAFRAGLIATKGLGSWSVEYICLRAMGDKDAFPKTDLILKRALALLDSAQLSPWRAYAATYLWRAYGEGLSRSRRAKSLAPEEVS